MTSCGGRSHRGGRAGSSPDPEGPEPWDGWPGQRPGAIASGRARHPPRPQPARPRRSSLGPARRSDPARHRPRRVVRLLRRRQLHHLPDGDDVRRVLDPHRRGHPDRPGLLPAGRLCAGRPRHPRARHRHRRPLRDRGREHAHGARVDRRSGTTSGSATRCSSPTPATATRTPRPPSGTSSEPTSPSQSAPAAGSATARSSCRAPGSAVRSSSGRDPSSGGVPDHAVVAGVPARIVRRFEPGVGWVAPAMPPTSGLAWTTTRSPRCSPERCDLTDRIVPDRLWPRRPEVTMGGAHQARARHPRRPRRSGRREGCVARPRGHRTRPRSVAFAMRRPPSPARLRRGREVHHHRRRRTPGGGDGALARRRARGQCGRHVTGVLPPRARPATPTAPPPGRRPRRASGGHQSAALERELAHARDVRRR